MPHSLASAAELRAVTLRVELASAELASAELASAELASTAEQRGAAAQRRAAQCHLAQRRAAAAPFVTKLDRTGMERSAPFCGIALARDVRRSGRPSDALRRVASAASRPA